QKATLQIVDAPKVEFDPHLPEYQRRNWGLAFYCYEYLKARDGLQALSQTELLQTQRTVVPGRMQIKPVQGKTLVMDGPHNFQKMTALINSFQQQFPGVKPAVLLAFKDDKDYEPVIPLIGNFADQIIITTFSTSQDLPVHSADPKGLVKSFQTQGFQAQAIP